MYLSDLVTASLIKPLQSDPDESNQYLEKPYIRALGAYPDAQVILNTLQSDSFTEKLAASLSRSRSAALAPPHLLTRTHPLAALYKKTHVSIYPALSSFIPCRWPLTAGS